MTDQEKTEMQQMIAAILPKQEQSSQAISAWGKPQTSQNTTPESVSVPVSIQTQTGKVRLYLNFTGVTSPEQIMSLLESLVNMGVPVDAWQDKKAWGGNAWKK